MRLGKGSQCIQNNSRLNASKFSYRIELQNLVHILREIQNHGHVAGLAGQTRARSAREYRSAEFSARRHRCDHILVIARDHQADRNLAIIGAIRRVHGAAAAIEADFPTQRPLEFIFQRGGLRE